jgi:putative oxidoreductase
MGYAVPELLGRILLAHMFLISGVQKIPGYEVTQAYMEAYGLAPQLLPLAILVEIAGAVLLVLGWQTRWAALGLAVFTVLVSGYFHTQFSDPAQMAQFMKNWTIIGGLTLLYAHGAGPYSLDWRRRRAAQGSSGS